MKFQITRTRYSFDPEVPPYPNSVLEEITVEERFYNSAHIAPSIREQQEEWFKRIGFDHRRLENGDFVRSNRVKCWFIEINSLDELIAMAKLEEEGIVFNGETIEIYDGYRE